MIEHPKDNVTVGSTGYIKSPKANSLASPNHIIPNAPRTSQLITILMATSTHPLVTSPIAKQQDKAQNEF
ncbi:hypothetical protein FIBSPDRAFT_852025 [Athelia psychrophila]|uniref:Uncharacterized protein n=1 Tax=Athelia psychrophila TaxID=1759441 RepID=A0A166RXS0_9AGAM|nr:hypothetical protein FIBSPDRAFT_872984 [Fibularhizoctonia sp. CBS 109695]KZP28780.1 hypothetical protein FIBSPDRAFT_852025 [Fibularhizoctonia sp. CBS 109695]